MEHTCEMIHDDVVFSAEYEWAMIDQFSGEIVRGPVTDGQRNSLFVGLKFKTWMLKGHRAYFHPDDVEQKEPMVCCRRPVHIYRGSWR